MIAMPGRSHTGPLPPLSEEGRALAERLRRHVAVLAKSERNVDLETAARYIESAFVLPNLNTLKAADARYAIFKPQNHL